MFALKLRKIAHLVAVALQQLLQKRLGLQAGDAIHVADGSYCLQKRGPSSVIVDTVCR